MGEVSYWLSGGFPPRLRSLLTIMRGFRRTAVALDSDRRKEENRGRERDRGWRKRDVAVRQIGTEQSPYNYTACSIQPHVFVDEIEKNLWRVHHPEISLYACTAKNSRKLWCFHTMTFGRWISVLPAPDVVSTKQLRANIKANAVKADITFNVILKNDSARNALNWNENDEAHEAT